MSFKKIVDQICNTLQSQAMQSFKSQWLLAQHAKKQAEIEDQEAALNVRGHYNRENREEINAYRYREEILDYQRVQIKSRVDKKYSDEFDHIIHPYLNGLWQQKVVQADFIEQLNRFFKRHPWLSSLADLEGHLDLPYQYINPIINSTLKRDNLFSLKNDGDTLPHQMRYSIAWPDVNQIQFEKRLHDFALQYLQQGKYSVFSQLQLFFDQFRANLSPLKDYRFLRIDVYHLLFKHFNVPIRKFSSPESLHEEWGGQLIPQIMPVELDELEQLDNNSKSHCSSWLINLGDNSNPYWVLLDKHNDKRTLYLPGELMADSAFHLKWSKINACFPIDETVQVENECPTEYTVLSKELIWQYQLFARVLPYCLQNDRSQPLKNYRNPMPFYHLVAYVWESFIRSCQHSLSVTSVFQNAYPLTEKPWDQLLKEFFLKEPLKKALAPLQAGQLLASIDLNRIQLMRKDPSKGEYTLSTVVEGDNFLQTCFMACFQPTSQMLLTLTAASKKDMPDVPMQIFDKVVERLDHVRFIINETNKAIQPGHFLPLVRLSNAAACNRLLQTVYSSPLSELAIDNRWHEAGRVVCELFKQQATQFKPQVIQNYLQKESEWRKTGFDPANAPKPATFEWQLAQFAQMGGLGLDAFFDDLRERYLEPWHPIHQTPRLNIPVLFDLNGDRLLSSAQYIARLNEELSAFIHDERCVPKFSQIHWILPNPSTRAAIEEAAKLIRAVSDCKYRHNEETESLLMYEFQSLSWEEREAWLKEFDVLAAQQDKPLMVMIRIPDLDNQVTNDLKANALKTRYRALQNKILDNQRRVNEKKLSDSTAIFYQGANGTLDPMVDIRNLKHRLKQPFDGKDETILLASHAPGIQQELQQNVEAHHEIVEQIEEKQVMYEEKKPDIKGYTLDLNRLITRHTIQTHLNALEESVNWREEFSLWVGSRVDASYLIHYMEPEALEKIRAYRSFFRMGIEVNQLPFGFYLAHHPKAQQSYILCYDENRSKRERFEWEAKTKEQRNPFILPLDNKAKAIPFDGDFRQCQLLGDNQSDQISLWRHLAKQAHFSGQQQQASCLQQASNTYINPLHPDIPILMTSYEVSGKLDRPKSLADFKKQLVQWAQGVLGDKKEKDFIPFFIDSMDEAQLKTLGQLSYHYDSSKGQWGSQHFLRMAYEIYHAFGKQHFSIWQKVVFANSQNAAELLDKSVLDAMGLSFVTLKDKSPAYTTIWFRLLEAQGKNTGMVRYDRLWYAYQILISYIDKRQLTLSDEVVARLLRGHDQFQPIVWLDRLYHCLKMTEGQLYETNAQQAILDNLDKIDWHHNGLIYGMTHNNMPYWSQDLALQAFEQATLDKGYEPLWDKPFVEKSLSVQFGRYLAAQLKVNFKHYQHYVKHIKPLLEGNNVSQPVARLLLVHLTVGIDSIIDWNSKASQVIVNALSAHDMSEVVTWLNQQFQLDLKDQRGRYQVALVHLPLIASVLKRYGLKPLDALGQGKRLVLLNAMGKVCQYLQSQALCDPQTVIPELEKMVHQAVADDTYLAAMHQTPWLVVTPKEAHKPWPLSQDTGCLGVQKRLLQQLESLSYTTSSWLPDRVEIQDKLSQLDDVFLSLEILNKKRRQMVVEWVGKGCHITEQDATFRELTFKEKEKLNVQCIEQFLPQHAIENTALISALVPYLVIEASVTHPEQVFENLVAQFKRVDNKPHFNDLGIVFGCLLQHLKKQAPGKMSLQQLSDILKSLMGVTHDELTHFPTDMLSELLTQAGNQLTNARLNELTAHLEPQLKEKVDRIVKADIAHQMKPNLLRLLPKGISEGQFSWILSHFTLYQINGLSHAYQNDVAKALLLAAECPSVLQEQWINTLLYQPVEDDFLSLWLKKHHESLGAVHQESPLPLYDVAKALLLAAASPAVLQNEGTNLSLYQPVDDKISSLWLKSRHELLKAVHKEGTLSLLQSMAPLLLSPTQKIPAIEVIGFYTLKWPSALVDELKNALQKLASQDLMRLAEYCAHPPRPSAEYLIKHLPDYSVDELIHRFETIDQARGLRHYSVTALEKEELKRVLAGIKEKSTGFIRDDKQKQVMGLLYYANAFAQEKGLANLSSAQLKEDLRQTARWMQATADETTQITYRLQLLSMLREVLLRQTGKWVNHTQMIDLIYAALHNKDSLFHQVKTGQGKSIITIMRVAFHALNGKVVDVFTAKESLSSRDHEEFGHILDAIGIEHNHITPSSDEMSYKVGDEVFGAVNYMTPGSFSLYQSGHCWSEGSQRYINYRSQERVAFFDEGDHALLDEQTMFNFSYGGDSGKLYNYDAWVYQATWRYFQTIKDELPTNEKGIPFISRKKHLAALCEHLQKQADFAPIQSGFIKTYLAPVIDENMKDKTSAVVERDKILAGLLSAAYTASHLEENRDYCVYSATTALSNGVTLQGRVAKVVINNQVQEGATYSERVHQFLHVLRNERALAQGEPPNFFIAPDSAIVLSQNVPSLIKQYYGQIEGCSGTMGDAGELNVYRKRFGIHHVVKLPTHERSQTLYKGMIFCEGQDAYEQAITECIKNNQNLPILLVSEDDVAVKSLSHRLRALLPEPMAKKLICDTNDSGRSEKDILPHAGKPGAIVNSSRMARGTDIKPETEEGLLVVRANPDTPRFAKQSGGRQGRNGAKGVLVDVIDYLKICQEYDTFAQSKIHAGRLAELMDRERHHLKKKFEKHQNRNSNQWNWLINDETSQEKYLKTRVVQYLKYEIKIQLKQNVRSKEALVSECSSHMIEQLMHQIGDDQVMVRNMRQGWLICRELIESAWQKRMNGATEDNEIVFNAFYEKAVQLWKTFASQYPDDLKANLLDDKESLFNSAKSMSQLAWNKGDDALLVPEPTQQADMADVIHFYQEWLKQVGPQVLSLLPEALQQMFYGTPNQGLNDLNVFYKALVSASQKKETQNSNIMGSNTQALFAQLANLPFPYVTYVPLACMTGIVKTFDAERATPYFGDKLACFKQLLTHSCAQRVPDLTAQHMMTLGKASDFIMRLVCRGFVAKETGDFKRFTTSQAVNHIADLLWQRHWSAITLNQFACLDRWINQDQDVAKLLTTQFSSHHWQKLLGQLVRYDIEKPEDREYLDTVLGYFRDHQATLNNSHPEALSALLDVFFYYPHRRVDAKRFPAPNALVHASTKDNIRFIHFLAEQFIMNENQIHSLVETINIAYGDDNPGAKAMNEEVMPKLLSLPANLPFEMIRIRLVRMVESRDLRGFSQAIDALTTVGQALNAFTNRKGITTQENTLPPTGDPEKLLSRAQDFILKLEKENRLYEAATTLRALSQAQYDGLDANTCLMAVEQYGSDYEKIVALLCRANNVMEAPVYSQFYKACLMCGDEKLGVAQLSRVVSLFETYGALFATQADLRQKQQEDILKQALNPTLIDSVINQLRVLTDRQVDLNHLDVWQQWQASGLDSQAFDAQIQFIKRTDSLPFELRNQICSLLHQGHSKVRLEAFVCLAEEYSKTAEAIPVAQLLRVLRHWQEEKIKDAQHLKAVLDAQKLANTLTTETPDNAPSRHIQNIPTFHRLFDSFSQNHQGVERFNLMHCIAHSLISFSEGLEKTCWSFYQMLIGKVGNIKQQMDQLPEEKKSLGLSKILRSMKGLTIELSLVAKPERMLLETGGQMNDYYQLIDAFERQYMQGLNYFTINRTRRAQAHTLFHHLKGIADPTQAPVSQVDFYESMLVIIDNTQKEIIEKDADNHVANNKGYSRLLDMTQQLGLQVCKDMIADPLLNSATKEKAKAWLLEQEKRVVHQLWHRLPSNHPIVSELAFYARNVNNPEPAAVACYKTAIVKLQPTDLPKNLRYLLPLLKGHFEVSEDMERQAQQDLRMAF